MIETGLYTLLSKTISHALRHDPALYGIELGEGGWIPLGDLVTALQKHEPKFASLEEDDVFLMLEAATKVRHEVGNGMIRALYGHSVPDRVVRVGEVPPQLLYHGTAPHFVEAIMAQGLLPMTRQFVHLSADLETARRVGGRKGPNPTILAVSAGAAHVNGAIFYKAGDLVWLTRAIMPVFIRIRT